MKGGDAASFCQLQGYPRRTQRGTKESGDGDPREMTANLDRAPPPARTGNRADRVFNPFAARHHSFNLQCLNPIWKRSWQHFGALTLFRCNCPATRAKRFPPSHFILRRLTIAVRPYFWLLAAATVLSPLVLIAVALGAWAARQPSPSLSGPLENA